MIQIPVSCGEIISSVCGTVLYGPQDTEFTGISTDTRNIAAGSLYIAICGQKYDGHDYLSDAILKGARGLLIANDKCNKIPRGFIQDITVITVDDTIKALGRIAGYRRMKTGVIVVAVTGSAGKTTTKDMLAAVLSQHFKLVSTEGNLNNEIGLPMTLLKLKDDDNAAVVEMGMRGIGEIDWLSFVAHPDMAVITNIGMAHIERLGSIQNILKAKMEIINGMKPNGIVLLNGDDPLLYEQADEVKQKGLDVILCGTKKNCSVRATDIKLDEKGSSFTVINSSNRFSSDPFNITLSVPGIHNIMNATLAIAAGLSYGISSADIAKALLNYSPAAMRMNIFINSIGARIIDDTYNANPQSVNAALETLAGLTNVKRRIAVLGTMLELGEWAPGAHREIGVTAYNLKIDLLVLIGENNDYTKAGAIDAGFLLSDIVCLNNNTDASEFLLNTVSKGDVVLIKGSRGMKMEEIVGVLK